MNWRSVELADVLDLQGGFAYKSKDWEVSGIPVLKITNVRNGKVKLAGCSYINEKIAAITSQFVVQKGDLLITLTGEIGATGFYQEDFESRLNQRVGKLVAKNPKLIDLMFLAYFLESPKARSKMWALSKGIAQANISPKEILSLKIPLPPIAEQHQIVEILEDHLSRLDAALADVKQVRVKLISLKLSWMHSRLAHLSETVGILQLGEISDTRLGKMLDSKNNAGKLTPYLRNINIQWGRVDVGDMKQVPLSKDEQATLALKNGDLLVCEGGEPGRCAIWTPTKQDPEVVCFQKALHRIRPHKEFRSRYLALIIEHAVRGGHASKFFTGTTIKHLPQEQLRRIPVPALEVSVQDDLLRELDELDSSNMRMLDSTAEILNSLNSLRRSLLQAAFTGQLTREVTHV